MTLCGTAWRAPLYHWDSQHLLVRSHHRLLLSACRQLLCGIIIWFDAFNTPPSLVHGQYWRSNSDNKLTRAQQRRKGGGRWGSKCKHHHRLLNLTASRCYKRNTIKYCSLTISVSHAYNSQQRPLATIYSRRANYVQTTGKWQHTQYVPSTPMFVIELLVAGLLTNM